MSQQPSRYRGYRVPPEMIAHAVLQRFASVHGVVQNLPRVDRHLLHAVHSRLLRTRSFGIWDEVTCAR